MTEPAFDPEDFGFERYIPKSFCGSRTTSEKDYLLYTECAGKTSTKLKLCMCRETGEFVSEIVGDTARVYVNEKGQLLLCKGSGLKVTKRAGSDGRTVVMSGLADRMREKHGPFRRLYLTAKPFHNGDAVLFAPNGEKDL